MIITIPSFAKDIEDEGIMLLLAFMMRMAKKSPDSFKHTAYQIHSADVRRLMRRYVIAPMRVTQGLTKYCRMYRGSNDVWLFEWKVIPEEIEYDFKNPEHTAVWGYIIAVDMHSQLVHDIDKYNFNEVNSLLLGEDKDFFRYTGISGKLWGRHKNTQEDI